MNPKVGTMWFTLTAVMVRSPTVDLVAVFDLPQFEKRGFDFAEADEIRPNAVVENVVFDALADGVVAEDRRATRPRLVNVFDEQRQRGDVVHVGMGEEDVLDVPLHFQRPGQAQSNPHQSQPLSLMR